MDCTGLNATSPACQQQTNAWQTAGNIAGLIGSVSPWLLQMSGTTPTQQQQFQQMPPPRPVTPTWVWILVSIVVLAVILLLIFFLRK